MKVVEVGSIGGSSSFGDEVEHICESTGELC